MHFSGGYGAVAQGKFFLLPPQWETGRNRPRHRSTPAPLRKSVTSSPALSKKLPKRTAFHLISGTLLERMINTCIGLPPLALREDSPWEGNVQPERQQRLCPLCFALGGSEPVRSTTLGECAGSARAAFPACRLPQAEQACPRRTLQRQKTPGGSEASRNCCRGSLPGVVGFRPEGFAPAGPQARGPGAAGAAPGRPAGQAGLRRCGPKGAGPGAGRRPAAHGLGRRAGPIC